jgi:hypothetical protein
MSLWGCGLLGQCSGECGQSSGSVGSLVCSGGYSWPSRAMGSRISKPSHPTLSLISVGEICLRTILVLGG